MAFKTIMSPAIDAHYPLRVIEIYVSTGELVKPDSRAVLAETAEGRRIAIKCAHEGRVLQIPSQGAILNERQMLLVIETFGDDAATDLSNGQKAREAAAAAAQDAAQREEAERQAQQSHQAAYAQAQGQRESIRPTKETSEAEKKDGTTENPDAVGETETTTKASAEAQEPAQAAPDEAGKTPSGRKRLLIAASFLGLLAGAAVIMQLIEPAPNSAGLTRQTAANATAKQQPAKSVPQSPSLPTRPYPADQDRDWRKVANRDAEHFITFSGNGSNAQNIEFLSLDASANQVHLIGRADSQTIMTNIRFGPNSKFRNVQYIGVNPKKAFIFANLPKSEWSTILIAPQDEKEKVGTYHYPESKGKPQSRSVFKEGRRLIYADRDGTLIALLMQDIDSGREGIFFINDKGKSAVYDLPDGNPEFLTSDFHAYAHVDLDGQTKDGLTQATALVAGSAANVFFPAQGYSYGISAGATSEKIDIRRGDGHKLDVTTVLPKGVFQKFGSAKDTAHRPLDGLLLTASAINAYDRTAAMGGYVHGMGNQRHEDGNYRADAYLSWQLGNGGEMVRMFVRSDNDWRNGLVVKDLEFFADGQLAVLLREYQGLPYSALVIFDRNGRATSRYDYRSIVMHDIDSYQGTLYAAGYQIRDGRRVAATWKF
ncbi:hypothetical protein [uncultured Cohaesibacter sp.]|uniref:hypothetical protein n=1 Tax=uncultured Cohaesibacter sp. TaxID=1002546 RepID=UPI0029C78568|nr:hypothetical protein [uncultured Cohaesibacter sp.]